MDMLGAIWRSKKAGLLHVHHGTSCDFTTFSDDWLGHGSGHPSAVLGHFFSTSFAVARSFCLQPDVIDMAYDGIRGSQALLDDAWLARREHPWLDGARVLKAGLQVGNAASIPARAFFNLVDEGASENDWRHMRKHLLSLGHDCLLIKADVPAVESKDLCMEYIADMWVSLRPEMVSVLDSWEPVRLPGLAPG